MPVTTRLQRKLGVASLTSLPVETLEQIFDLAYEETPPTGPICKRLLPFHRARVTSLRLPKTVTTAYLKKLLLSYGRLRKLHLVQRRDVPAILTALPRPSSLDQLNLEDCVFKTKTETYADAERALSASLAPLVSLRKLRLRSDYEVKEKAQAKVLTEAFPALPQSHSTLPLRHLYLGKQVKIPAAHLEEVVQQLAMTLRHLTLQFFNGRSGRNGETWQPREDRYDEFEASWKLPEWRWDFDQWEMKRLFGLWKNKGIKVDGSAVKALRVAEKYDRELIVFEEMEEENYHLLFRHWDS